MTYESKQEGRPLSELTKYPQWNERLVEMRWHHEWWDGPMDGSVVYEGQRYWFSIWCDTDAPGNPYYYFAYPLSEEEADWADCWSEKNEAIGNKWRSIANDPARKQSPELPVLSAEWEKHRSSLPDFTQRPPIAWFCSGANSSFYGVELTQA
ncbi:hypothetical protein [Verrucomicrobium sp. BvORR034]|uniref:hypothetical protein n=1 Tax=Verrucomicrobium sp. BvORR034 TaxID=1396418 RepID=UPI002240FB7B|nr:hypothetical protein [Verrucomicrobium sp. BvORR034]